LQIQYPDQFDREMGCTEAEWLRWLPLACGSWPVMVDEAARQATVRIGDGHCALNWSPLPDRKIALMRIPRLSTNFAFDQVDAEGRVGFMRHFDLYTQRGGG
jgi:hypothetical protein